MNKYDQGSAMIRKTISMPDAMGRYIDRRVKSGQYGNDSEYIRDLIRKDQEERQSIAAIQAAIQDGMGGEGEQILPSQIRHALKQEVRRRAR